MATANITVELSLRLLSEWEGNFRKTNITAMLMCEICMALVPDDYAVYHEGWHRDMDNEED